MSNWSGIKADGLVARVVLIVICALVLTLTYFGFSPPYSIYIPLVHVALNPGEFSADPVLSTSVYLRASIYYDAIALIGFPITKDFLGLAMHYILNGSVMYLLYFVARKKLGITERSSAICLVISLSLITSTFVLGSLSSVITVKTPTPTGLAHIAGMASYFSHAFVVLGCNSVMYFLYCDFTKRHASYSAGVAPLHPVRS